jgi:hypothetical protein
MHINASRRTISVTSKLNPLKKQEAMTQHGFERFPHSKSCLTDLFSPWLPFFPD